MSSLKEIQPILRQTGLAFIAISGCIATFPAHASSVPNSATFVAGPLRQSAIPNGAIVLSPGANIQAAVNNNPAGATFYLQAGTYRTQQIAPKDGNAFIGAYGATLNGSRLLSGFTRSGSAYMVSGQTAPGTETIGFCAPGFPRCNDPQDLYVDGKPLRAVSSRSSLQAGTWYFDHRAGKVYLYDDPSGHAVELGYTPYAFGGSARNVKIQNLTVQQYASADQRGAIGNNGAGAGWKIVNSRVALNHGVGIILGSGGLASGNDVSRNGGLGIGGGTATGITVTGNLIASNVWNGTKCDWECGGAKFGQVTGLMVSGNYVHDNQGPGLWADENSRNVTFQNNRVERNLLAGISDEIGSGATISGNVLAGNGATTYGWGWNAQIQIQNTSNAQVSGNTITLDPSLGGNGISIIQQNRGSQYLVHDVSVFNNDLTMAGGDGMLAGWFVDYNEAAYNSGRNVFSGNRYHAFSLDPDNDFWVSGDSGNFAAWQRAGQDLNGSAEALRAAGGSWVSGDFGNFATWQGAGQDLNSPAEALLEARATSPADVAEPQSRWLLACGLAGLLAGRPFLSMRLHSLRELYPKLGDGEIRRRSALAC